MLYKKVIAQIARNMRVLKDIKCVCMRIVSCPSLLRNFFETAAFFFSVVLISTEFFIAATVRHAAA